MLFVGLVLAWKIPRLPGFGEAASDTSYWAEHRAIYGSPHLALPGLVFLWYAVCFIALLAVLPTLFRLPLWVVTLMPLISLVGTFGAGVACRYASPSHVALVGFSVSLILSAGIFVHPDPVITSLALMLALGLVPGACFAAIPHYNTTPEARARATGGLAQCGNIGTTFGTPLFALAATYGERVGVAALTALFCAIGIAATLRLRRGIK